MRRFLIRLKRTISFLPTIWKGADWDYRYAVDLFTYQLSRTANYIESKDRHTTAQSDVIRMRTAIALLNKVYEEEYGMEYMDEIESKYGKSSIDFVESNVGVSQINLDEKGPYYDMIEVYENNYTDMELLMIAEERSALMHESRHKQKRAHKVAWDLIEHNIQKWWD